MYSILVIDDDDSSCRLFKTILEKAGYSVMTASNGFEGLKMLRKNCIDLVITDIIMPVMEGVETIMNIKKEYPRTKILAMTGQGRLGHMGLDIAGKLGADHSFKKPFENKDLLDIVETTLRDQVVA